MTNFNTDGEIVFTEEEWVLILSAIDGALIWFDTPDAWTPEDHKTMEMYVAIKAVIEFWLDDQTNQAMS